MGIVSQLLAGLGVSSDLNHYDEECRSVGGARCKVSLVEAVPFMSSVGLVYRWHERLSHSEADKLDSRLRAYIACVIGKAAENAELDVEPGPAHGRRPSWVILQPSSDKRVAYGLQQGSFDVGKQVCEMTVGPVVLPIVPSSDGDTVARELAESFLAIFRELKV